MSEFPFVIDIQDSAHFQQQVIELSKQQPILVDFWADWCQPCKVLIPLLHKLSNDYKGEFLLAKVNADEQSEIVTTAGVRNLPTVKLYINGDVVDEFTGAKSEAELIQFLDKHIESENSKKIKQALTLSDAGEHEQAIELLKEMNQADPRDIKVHITIAQAYLNAADYENCSAILKSLPANIQIEPEVKQIQDALELAQATADAPAIDEVLSQLESQPNDHKTRIQLAKLYTVGQKYESALEALMIVLNDDMNFNEGEARTNMIAIFTKLGAQDPLTRQYRTKLATLLN